EAPPSIGTTFAPCVERRNCMRKLVAIALAGTLAGAANGAGAQPAAPASPAVDAIDAEASRPDASLPTAVDQHEDEGDLRITQHIRQALIDADDVSRSEERRVGKECRCRGERDAREKVTQRN